MLPALIILSDIIETLNNYVTKVRLSLKLIKNLGLAICISLMHITSFAQHDTAQYKLDFDSVKNTLAFDTLKSNGDSATIKLIRSFKQFAVDEERKNNIEYFEDTIATKQDEIIEEVKRLTLEAKNYLKNGLDTNGLSTEIIKIENWYDVSAEGVFTNTGTIQTRLNLETSSKILKELLARALARKSSLDFYYKNLVGFRNKIDSLSRDSVLYKLSSDSTVLMRYVEKLIVVSQEIAPADSAFKKTLESVSELQPTLNRLVNKLNASIEQIDFFQRELSNKAFKREIVNIGGPVRFKRSLTEIINFSKIKGGLAFVFYLRNNYGKTILLLILILISVVFLVSIKRNLQVQNLLNDGIHRQYVLKYPALSALVIILNISQFIFIDPPFIFNVLIWVTSAISLTIILRKSIARHWMFAWQTMFFLFLFACADNLILQVSRTERWIMFALSIAGILSGSIIILMGYLMKRIDKIIIYSTGFVVIMQIASLVANIYGRYNLSKSFLSSGFINVIIAILFLWTIRLINEALSLSKEVYNNPEEKLFYIDFKRVGSKAPPILYVFLIIGWFVLFARNFYAYRYIIDPIKNFIYQKKTIGSFSFTIENLLEFFLILYIAGLTSRIVSFFASDTYIGQDGTIKRGGIGSKLLLIRIAIFCIGLLLAFAATGIPMDRATIILSALGVGIGFGLQTLINNLVSGLIISFEKPVNVGDIVEINGQLGTVKSIGFRSSIISTSDGSVVVIPNGDLLNRHLINWTHSNSARRVEIIVGVANGTDLEKVIQILKDLPVKDERILSNPEPNVIIKEMNNNIINLQLFFWVQDIRKWTAVKSDFILAMDSAFKENEIAIAFSQQN
ncbi:mechanosensitive ion channel [Chitinophagaceae bacterium LB-8]|uniref:Mechanosensitive ion channel n=1 Tax=Paraflavisolibacter caeni TaxID=2982496 RepID=A0A9X2XTR8_9BACT|nr:mechanosensitive ion channel domain-containing protein [Paraflavisolibacter caeni]MCU7549079.1 mechanosensitive ion channel [Paraflavisolibacter caeni]